MLYAILTSLFFFNSIACMDQKENVVNRSLALSIILRHGIEIFDHQTICFCAINKECDMALRETACLRRKYFTEHFSDPIIGKLTWHKYGGAVGKTGLYFDTFYSNFFFLSKIDPFGKAFSSVYGQENYHDLVPGFKNAQFDSNGRLTFYVVKTDLWMLWNEIKHIIQCTLSLSGQMSKQRCGIKLKEQSYDHHALSYLLPFPALLKALLQSTVELETDITKLYSLENAIIPHNYRDCNPSKECSNFEDLPQMLKDAIESVYAKQCSEPK